MTSETTAETSKVEQKPSFYSLTLNDLKSALEQSGFKTFSATQLFNWIYARGVFEPENWTNISKALKQFLLDTYSFELPKIVWNGKSQDGTRKFLVATFDGQTVETVMIPARDRYTICISSQVGCAIACTFCHTGTMGLKRHLVAGEIVGQFLAVQNFLKGVDGPDFRLTNIVYMGQGEPLHNFKNVKASAEIFTEDQGLSLSQRRITLSTSGLVPQIEKLWDFPPVNIAISLHAAHNNIRTELMPINKAYDLTRLFEAIKKIPLKAYRRITYEYLLIDGLNDRIEDVEGLEALLDKKYSKINLIPFNEYPESKFKRPSDEHIAWFQKSLLDRGFVCTIRTTKGTDILAACGQLKSMKDGLNLWDDKSQRKLEASTAH
jgi:23S rRNA (adenine2503-C2)-methyltransferase